MASELKKLKISTETTKTPFALTCINLDSQNVTDPEATAKPTRLTCIIFDPHKAADVEDDMVLSLSLSLSDVKSCSNSLFSPSSREVAGVEEDGKMDSSTSSSPQLLSGHLQLDSAPEHLIQSYKILEELLGSNLVLLGFHQGKLRFLEGVPNLGAQLPRKVMAQQLLCDAGFLEMLCKHAIPAKQYNPSVSVVNLFSVVSIELLGELLVNDSDAVRRLLSFVFSGLESPSNGGQYDKLLEEDAEGKEVSTLQAKPEIPVQSVLNMQVPVEPSKKVIDCKNLIKSLVMGMKTIIWSITHLRIPRAQVSPSQQAPQQRTQVSASSGLPLPQVSKEMKEEEDPHGSVNTCTILKEGIVIGVESRSTISVGNQGDSFLELVRDDNVKFKVVIPRNGTTPPVIITAAGSKARNDRLWEQLEYVGSRITTIEDLSNEVIRLLGPAPDNINDRCYIFLAGYSNESQSFVVIRIQEGKTGTEWLKTFNSEFDCVAIGSGENFAMSRLNEWDAERRNNPHWNPRQLYFSAAEATRRALVDSTVDDPACGGVLRVIWLRRDGYSEAHLHPISEMCIQKPGFRNMALLFFSQESYRLMNYAKLEKILVNELWLPERDDSHKEKAPPSCLGVVADAHLFLVNFGRINDSRNYAEEYFELCEEMGSDGTIRGVWYDTHKLLVCKLDYDFLGSILEGRRLLPWKVLSEW